MIISLLTALDDIKSAFTNTKDLNKLCFYLSVPQDKRNAVDALKFFLKWNHPRKVRKLVFYLDYIGDTTLANSVMNYAELPSGIYK